MPNEEQPASATGESASAVTKSLDSSYKESRMSAGAGGQPERVTLGRGKLTLTVGYATINENPDSGRRKLFVKSTFQRRTKTTKVQSYDRSTRDYMWNEEFVFPLPNETSYIGPVRLRVFQKHSLQKSSSIGEASVYLRDGFEKAKKWNSEFSKDLVKGTDETEKRIGSINVSICFEPEKPRKRKWPKVSKGCKWCFELGGCIINILVALPFIGPYFFPEDDDGKEDDDGEEDQEATKDNSTRG